MSEDKRQDSNPLIQVRKELVSSIAPQMIDKDIAEAVLAICDSNEEPSREKIIAWLNNRIKQTASSLGDVRKDLDIARASLESAICRIESTYQKE